MAVRRPRWPRSVVVVVGRSGRRPRTSSRLPEPPKRPEHGGGVMSCNVGGHLGVIWAGGGGMVALGGAPGGQWWMGERGEMCVNFSLVESERVKDMDQLPSPTCEDTFQGAHFNGGLTAETRCTRSALSGSRDSCRPVSDSDGPNRPFWAQSRPAAALDQPHVPMPWIYGLGSHGGGLQCPLLAHPMVSRGDRRSARRVLSLEASPPKKSGATNTPPPGLWAGLAIS